MLFFQANINTIANDQREITPKIYKVELWFLCMTHCLIVLYNCMKFHSNSFDGCQIKERTRNSIANDQREIIPKIPKAELWFLFMTHHLIVLYNCMKFHFNSFNGCQVTERTRNSIANNQREITPKISRAELWFLCISHCLIVRYKCMKFHQIDLTVFNLQSGHEIAFTYVTRGIIGKIYMQELWFLCMTRRLDVLYKCMKFC